MEVRKRRRRRRGERKKGGVSEGRGVGEKKRGRDKRESSIDSKRVCSITNIYDIHAVNKEKE